MNNHFGMKLLAKAAERGASLPADAGLMEAGPALDRKIVRVSAREADGSELSGRATLVIGKDGRPEKLELRNCIPPAGDVLLVQDGRGNAYRLTLRKSGGDLEMKTRLINGLMIVQEFTVAKSMRIYVDALEGGVGTEKNDTLESWGDIMGQMNIEELANAVQGHVQELTKEEILRAKLTFRNGTEITGEELFRGHSVELDIGQIRVEYGEKEFAADVLTVENANRTIRLKIIQREVKELPDFEATFKDAKRRPVAFSADIDGYIYAGVMV